ncbi:MAG: PrsW family intramembrane metalloprotease [Candidatus Heimdallarchaeota archaeon]|nr:PrsW family intramembrane metalloprotease [Candidatus Heimdallarchaeota archaeon]
MISSFEQILLLFLPINFIAIALFWRYFYRSLTFNKSIKFYTIHVLLGLLSPLLSLTITYFLQVFTHFLFADNLLLLIDFVILIPLVEEISKAYIVHLINKYRQFRSIKDGLIAGLIVGLVFALVENSIFALSSYLDKGLGSAITLFTLRGIFTIIGHPLFTSLNGVAIATMNFFKNYNARKDLLKSYLLHAGWNASVLSPSLLGIESMGVSIVVLYFFGILIISALTATLIREKSYVFRLDSLIIKNHLAPF